MALAIDSTTPPYLTATTNVNTLTTASFSPPAGSLIVVPVTNAFGFTTSSVVVASGTLITFTQQVHVAAQGVDCSIWTGLASASPGAITIRATASSASNGWEFGAAVITGQAASQTGAATGTNSAASGTNSVTTGVLAGANSLLIACFSNGGATVGTLTMHTGNSNTFATRTFADSSSADAGWAQYLTGMNLAAGATGTLQVDAPTTTFAAVALEILAGAAAAAAVTPYTFNAIPFMGGVLSSP